MDDKQIDKLFQSGLSDFPVEFNDAHWEEMKLLLAKKKKRRGFFFWLFCAGLFVFVGAHAVWTYLDTPEPKFISTEHTSEVVVDEPFYVKAERSFDYPFLPEGVEGAYVSGGFGAMRTELSNPTSASKDVADAQMNEQTSAPDDEVTIVEQTATAQRSSGNPTNKSGSSVSNMGLDQSTKDVNDADLDSEPQGNAEALTNEPFEEPETSSGLDLLTPLQANVPGLEQDRPMFELDLPKTEKRYRKYISFQFGPDLHMSNKNSSQLMPASRDIRSEQEDNAMRFRVGVNAGMEIGKMDLSLGSELAVLGETTNYRSFTETDSVLVDNSYYQYEDVSYWSYDSIFDGNNWTYIDSLFINAVDSTLIEVFIMEGVEREYNLSVKNGPVKHYLLNFPITVGYRTRVGNIGLTIRQGLNIGLLTRSTGYIITSNGKDLISVSDPELQRRTLLLSSITSLRFQYFLREELALNLTPRVDIPFQSLFRNSAYDRKYTSLSVSFGLSYYFH